MPLQNLNQLLVADISSTLKKNVLTLKPDDSMSGEVRCFPCSSPSRLAQMYGFRLKLLECRHFFALNGKVGHIVNGVANLRGKLLEV